MAQLSNQQLKFISRLCGIVCLIAGIVITVISACGYDFKPSWRLVSGIVFILLGIFYLFIARKYSRR